MASDNTELNAGSGGDKITTAEVTFSGDTTKTQIVGLGLVTGSDESYAVALVDATNPLPIEPGTGVTFAVTNDDTVSTNNSTVATLGIGANFTPTADDVLGYTTVTITLFSNVDSATDGMTFQFSSDNSNWDDTNTFTYTAAKGTRRFEFPVTARYFRVNYTNGGTGQGSFRVQTILHRQCMVTSIHRLVDDISPDRSATLVKAVIAAQSAGTGDYMVVQATASGHFKVSVEEVNGVEMPVVGTVAHDSPDTGDAPLKMGGVATTSEPAAVADADIVNAYFDETGHQHVKVDASALPAGASTSALQTTGNTALAAIQAAVEILDDWDESDRAMVNLIVGQAGIAAGTGADGVTVPRVTLATNVALPAGNNNIGNVDIVTLPAANLGQQAMAASVSIVPASNITDATYIGDIKFGEAEPNSAAIAASLAIMDDWDEADRAAVNLIAGQAGIAANAGVMDAQTTRTTISTNDTQFGTVGEAADPEGPVHGQLRYIAENIDEVHVMVDGIDDTTSWAASTDATGITQESANVPAHTVTTSLSIDKGGTATTEASYGKALGATVDGTTFSGNAIVSFYVKHTNWTNIETVFVRIGDDASNYMEYAIDPTDLSTTIWSNAVAPLHEGVQTGTGLDLANIDYVAFGFTTTASGNQPSDVFFNYLELQSVSASEITVSPDVGAAPVRVAIMGNAGNAPVATGAGAVSSGVQRGTLASNDPAVVSLASIDTSTQSAATEGTLGNIDSSTSSIDSNTSNTSSSVANIEAAVSGNEMLIAGGATQSTDVKVTLDSEAVVLGAGTETIGGTISQQSTSGAYDGTTAQTIQEFMVVGTTNGNNTIIPAVASRFIRMLHLEMIALSATANTVYFVNDDFPLIAAAANPIPIAVDADADNHGGFITGTNWRRTTDTVNQAVVAVQSSTAPILYMGTFIEVA